MARDVGEGYLLVTERTFKTMNRPELDQVVFELDRYLRELRGEVPPQDDTAALQQRQRKIQRLNSAISMLRSYRMKHKT